MGMSTYVVGFRPADATFDKMRSIYDACQAAKVTIPPEVSAFFEGERPDSTGVRVELYKNAAVRDYEGQDSTGIEVDVTKLPPGVTIVRFVNSW